LEEDLRRNEDGRFATDAVEVAVVAPAEPVTPSQLRADRTVGSQSSTRNRSLRKVRLASRVDECVAVPVAVVEGGVGGAFSCDRRTSARWLKRIITIWRTTNCSPSVCCVCSAHSQCSASRS
uniref:Polyprotein n=1 Tax=Taenia asiatica TaxID=60517 RepID=A0A0R3W711_TAEAS